MIPGSIPIWTKRAANNQSNFGDLLTAPPNALHLTDGDIYAPSIMVAGCFKSIAIQLGDNCKVTSEFSEQHCPLIRQDKISIIKPVCKTIKTLSFLITISDKFIESRNNISVTFIQYAVDGTNYNISGYLYFDSQPDNNCATESGHTNTSNDPIQCTCNKTEDPDPKKTANCSLQLRELELCQQMVSSNNLKTKVFSGCKLMTSCLLHISGFLVMLLLFLFNHVQ